MRKNLSDFLNHQMAFPKSLHRIVPVEVMDKEEKVNHEEEDEDEGMMFVDDFRLKERWNLFNSMAASSAAKAAKVKKENIRESLLSIESVKHRSQLVATVGGVDFIDDSKGTNVNCTWYALESITKPVILILGGIDNGNDYRILDDLVDEKVKAIVCLGLSNEKIHEAFDGMVEHIVDTHSADSAVQAAYKLAVKGDAVLMSPACASFDLFKNYEDRGDQFAKAVKKL